VKKNHLGLQIAKKCTHSDPRWSLILQHREMASRQESFLGVVGIHEAKNVVALQKYIYQRKFQAETPR
jgi:hypothetical protein